MNFRKQTVLCVILFLLGQGIPLTVNQVYAETNGSIDEQGIGTWVYRFGDAASADKSVVLEVPPSAAPRASTYQTTLIWELSSVPDNQK